MSNTELILAACCAVLIAAVGGIYLFMRRLYVRAIRDYDRMQKNLRDAKQQMWRDRMGRQ